MEQNKYEKLFDEMLKQLGVQLIKYGKNVYRLASTERIVDTTTFFENADSIIEELSIYITDSFVGDLEEEAEAYNITSLQTGGSWEELLVCIEEYKAQGSSKERKFAEDHQWEIDVLDMVCYHFGEVNLQRLTSTATHEKVYYITLQETYSKTVRVIAEDEEQAQESAMDALNCGAIECKDYVEDSTNIIVEADFENWYEDFEEIPLFDKNGNEQ